MNVILVRNDVVVATELEVEIVKHFAEGMRVADIAQKACIPVRTLESKVAAIKDKYDVATIPALVFLFAKNKLIE